MKIVFTGKSRGLFELLKVHFCDGTDTVSFFDDGLTLMRNLVFNDITADLILLENSLYKGFADFFYNVLDSRNLKIPLILLGDSGLAKGNRLSTWISENEFQYDIQNLHKYVPVLNKINLLIESSEFKRLLEKTEENHTSSDDKTLVKINKINPVDNLRRKANLSPAIYNLLRYLYKNRCREVSLLELEKEIFINAGGERTCRNVVYAYISRLRKCMDSVPLCTMEILRTRRGHYKLLLR